MMAKDLALARDAAREAGVGARLGAQAAELYARFRDAGDGGLDYSAIVKSVAAAGRRGRVVSGADGAPGRALLDCVRLIERLHRRFLDVVKGELDRRGLRDINNVQAVLLSNIQGETVTVGELTARGYYLDSNVSYNVKKLVENGYLERERSEHDRRTTRLRVSGKGRPVVGMVDALFAHNSAALAGKGLDDPALARRGRATSAPSSGSGPTTSITARGNEEAAPGPALSALGACAANRPTPVSEDRAFPRSSLPPPRQEGGEGGAGGEAAEMPPASRCGSRTGPRCRRAPRAPG